MRRKSGAGKGEALAFLIILGLAAMVIFYLNQKPKVVERTVVVQPATMPEAVQEAPPPPPVEPTTLPEVVKPVVVMAPPPPPQCVIIEAKLRDAQGAVLQAQSDLTAANKAAVENLHKTPDYITAKADVADKQQAREAAAAQLTKDTASGADTDHDLDDIRTAAKNLLDAKVKLTAMETDAVAADPTIADKQQALKTALANVADLRQQLSDYIVSAIASNCAVPDCAIDSLAFDTGSWTLRAQLTPASQPNAGAVADAAMNQIGRIIEKALYKSPFTWNTAKFTVFADYRQKRVPEFQLTYLRPAVDATDFAKVDHNHYDNDALLLLAQTVWLSQAANDIQGSPAPQGVIQPATAMDARPTIKYTDSLTIGGYVRADGSMCPTSYIRQSHSEEMPATASPTGPATLIPPVPSYTAHTVANAPPP